MIQLIITYDQTSDTIQVSGPIDNKMLSYGMLEAAKDAVRTHAEAKLQNRARSSILVPAHHPTPE